MVDRWWVGGGGGDGGDLKFKYPKLTTMLLVWKIIANSAWVLCWPGYLGRTQDHANKRREIRARALSQWEPRHRQNKFCDPTAHTLVGIMVGVEGWALFPGQSGRASLLHRKYYLPTVTMLVLVVLFLLIVSYILLEFIRIKLEIVILNFKFSQEKTANTDASKPFIVASL